MFLVMALFLDKIKVKRWLISACIFNMFFLSGCVKQNESIFLEDEARNSLEELYIILNGDEQIIENAAAILIIPKITSASFFVGGSYGEGVLFIKDAAVEHYSIATASYGLELGASIFSQALIFMSSKALKEFRTTDGWELSADAYYTYKQSGKTIQKHQKKLRVSGLCIRHTQTAPVSIRGCLEVSDVVCCRLLIS